MLFIASNEFRADRDSICWWLSQEWQVKVFNFVIHIQGIEHPVKRFVLSKGKLGIGAADSVGPSPFRGLGSHTRTRLWFWKTAVICSLIRFHSFFRLKLGIVFITFEGEIRIVRRVIFRDILGRNLGVHIYLSFGLGKQFRFQVLAGLIWVNAVFSINNLPVLLQLLLGMRLRLANQLSERVLGT